GGSVARDAPAPWLEGGLGRKPPLAAGLEGPPPAGSAPADPLPLRAEGPRAAPRGLLDARRPHPPGTRGKEMEPPMAQSGGGWGVGWTTWWCCPPNCSTPSRSTRRGPATTNGPRCG